MKYKRKLTYVLAVLLLVSLLGDLGGAAAAGELTVYVSVSDRGSLAVTKTGEPAALLPVTVPAGSTIEDAVVAAHAAYCPAGAEGWQTAETEWGRAMTRIWGRTEGVGSYYEDGAMPPAQSWERPARDGSRIDLILYREDWGDSYACFDRSRAAVYPGEELRLTLSYEVFDENWAPCAAPMEGAEVKLTSGETLGTTDASGKVALRFAEPGEYVVTAACDDPEITAPCCLVTVKALPGPATGVEKVSCGFLAAEELEALIRLWGENPGEDAASALLFIAVYRSSGELRSVRTANWIMESGTGCTDVEIALGDASDTARIYLVNGKTLAPLTEPQVIRDADGWTEAAHPWGLISRTAYLDRTRRDLEEIWDSVKDQLTQAQLTAAEQSHAAGVEAIMKAETPAAAQAACRTAAEGIRNAVPLAEGILSYKKAGSSERTRILGILERYAVDTGITGISFYENGGYTMYDPRITLGTDTYITGYGFGLLPEGSITADMDSEENPAWKRYYHTYESTDPGTLNYWNDQGAQVGDLFSYQAASFCTNFMNAAGDGYDWVPELAKDKPLPVNDDDADGMCTVWRFRVRTGDDGLKYSTGSTLPSRQAFNDRPVAPEDYETVFKLMLTQANGLYRGSELANTSTGAIDGAKAYYDATAAGPSDELWEGVGIRTYPEGGENWFEVTFAEEQTQFYAMYYISSSLYMPLPQDFIDLVTPASLFGFSADSAETPVDNALSVGPYYLSDYSWGERIVFTKNPNYVFADTKYAIEGIHVKIFPAAQEDPSAGFNAFLAGFFDSAGIPADRLEEFRDDSRTRRTTGDSNFKLNVNATDAETWEYLFGEGGTVTWTAESDYWELKPWLGNRHFVQALSYAFDRLTFANARGCIPTVDYLASNYMSDPENGISYAATEAHRKAVQSLLEGTDGCGYSLEQARDCFRMALTELETEGSLTPGTREDPTVLHMEIAWMRPTQKEQYHLELKDFFETAFNDDSVCGGVYRLRVDFWSGEVWSDVYYKKMLVGQFDIGFGSISGNSLDPIGFISVLSSDQRISGSFTLNWSVDTNDPAARLLVYDGKAWSFDALYNAVNSQATVVAGQNKAILDFGYNDIVKNEDGSYTGSFVVIAALPELTDLTPTRVVCCNYERYYNGDGSYEESDVDFQVTEAEGIWTVTFTVPADLAESYATGSGTSEVLEGYTGFDLYYDLVFNGETTSAYESVTDHFRLD